MATQTGVKKLEKKVNLLSKVLHLLLYEEKEKISKKEVREIERRLSAYLKARKDDFINLKDVIDAVSKHKQKGSKRA